MKHQLQTIREALNLALTWHDAKYEHPFIKQALTALSELERLAGEQKPVARVDGEGQVAWFAPIPEDGANLYATPPAQQPQEEHLTITWDEQQTRILAVSMQDEEGRILKVLAEAPAQQPQYEAGDMASAHNDGFRAGAASVAQQPQEIEVVCPVCSHTFYAWPGEHKAKQPQAEAVPLPPQVMVDMVPPATARDRWMYEQGRLAERDPRTHAAPQQAEAVPVVDRVYEAAKRLVDHADFQLGGVLSAKSKTRDIPSNAASKVKARHLASLRDALAKTPHQAEAVQACGHPMSLLLRSAESNEPLYCEACDDKSGRHDAERLETELLDANRRLQEKIASADALKLHAIEELCQLGYTVKDGELVPPDHLHKLMEAANHPLCGKQTEAVPHDMGVMELAESVGLIGPASRTDDFHAAIQRFHDLISMNVSIKAAVHFAQGLPKKGGAA